MGRYSPVGGWADTNWVFPSLKAVGAAWPSRRCPAAGWEPGVVSAVPNHGLASRRVGLMLAVPKHQRLHRAGSSLPFRLEAATNPTTSDSSYSDRASSRSSAYTRRENRLAALSSRAEEETNRDYKKVGFFPCIIATACTSRVACWCRNLHGGSLESKRKGLVSFSLLPLVLEVTPALFPTHPPFRGSEKDQG